MPARSKSQQRLMALVHLYKTDRLKNAPKKVKDIARHMSDEDARDFARTSHDGLPEKKASYWGEYFARGSMPRFSDFILPPTDHRPRPSCCLGYARQHHLPRKV